MRSLATKEMGGINSLAENRDAFIKRLPKTEEELSVWGVGAIEYQERCRERNCAISERTKEQYSCPELVNSTNALQ